MSSNSLVFSGSDPKGAATTEFLIRGSCGNPPNAEKVGKNCYDFMVSKGYHLLPGSEKALLHYADKRQRTMFEVFASVFIQDPLINDWVNFLKCPKAPDWYIVEYLYPEADASRWFLLPSRIDAIAFTFDMVADWELEELGHRLYGDDDTIEFVTRGGIKITVQRARAMQEAVVENEQVRRSSHAIKNLYYDSDTEEYGRLKKIPGLSKIDTVKLGIHSFAASQKLSLGASDTARTLQGVLSGMYGRKVPLNIAGEFLAALFGVESWQHFRGIEKRAESLPWQPFLLVWRDDTVPGEYACRFRFAPSMASALAWVGSKIDDRPALCSLSISNSYLYFGFDAADYDPAPLPYLNVIGPHIPAADDSPAKKQAQRFDDADPANQTQVLGEILAEMSAADDSRHLDLSDPRFDFPLDIGE